MSSEPLGLEPEKDEWFWSDQQCYLPDFPMHLDAAVLDYGIDPTTLHYEYFPEAAAAPSSPPQCSSSSSESSAASLSPLPEPAPAPTTPPNNNTSNNNNDPAAELAHRVCQSAGVMLAVPMNGFAASFQAGANAVAAGKLPIPRLPRPGANTSSSSSSSSAASTPPPSTPISCSSSPSSTSPSTNTNNNNATAAAPTTTTTTTTFPRPKTSHTTIERRYRTNLNARIQSLRMAVPALRVLEDRDPASGGSGGGNGTGKKIKKNIRGGVVVKGAGGIGIECTTLDDGGAGAGVDVIDERGFVDGVKVARKCSKANVLGKAVEYIRVLKKRELRLKAEQRGLKALVSGLVGGPALVGEWERQWRDKFGGEERDEVEGEPDEEPGATMMMEGEDDDEESEDDDEDGRKRKRAKLSSSSPSTKKKERKPPVAHAPPVVLLLTNDPNNGLQMPEKRKRGRPRKVQPLPPAAAAAPVPVPLAVAPSAMHHPTATTDQDQMMMMMPPPDDGGINQWQQQQPQQPTSSQSQPQQFLLAVFALFSLFNSPYTTGTGGRDHQHAGKVLTPPPLPLVYAPEIVSQFVVVSPSSSSSMSVMSGAWKEYAQAFHLVVTLLVLVSLFGSWFSSWVVGGRRSRSRSRSRSKRDDWIKLGEESLLAGEASTLSLIDRFQIYRSVTTTSSISDLVTCAMVMQSAKGLALVVVGGGGLMARMKARELWSLAAERTRAKGKVSERLVLSSMEVGEACERVVVVDGAMTKKEKESSSTTTTTQTPLEVLGGIVVKERLKEHLGKMFVDVVGDDENENSDGEELELDLERKRETVDAARELGGFVEELGRLFERAWKARRSLEIEDVERVFGVDDDGEEEDEIKALFVALVLYTRLFDDQGGSSDDLDSDSDSGTECPSRSPSSMSSSLMTALLSPPPTPRAQRKMVMSSSSTSTSLVELRKVLGCKVFEELRGRVEDARDRAVDLIVDVERRERGAGCW